MIDRRAHIKGKKNTSKKLCQLERFLSESFSV